MPDNNDERVRGAITRDRTPTDILAAMDLLEPRLRREIAEVRKWPRRLINNVRNDFEEHGDIHKKSAELIGVVSAIPSILLLGRERRHLPDLQQVFTLFIFLQVLSAVFISPVAATSNTEDQTLALSGNEFLLSGSIIALSRFSDNQCTPDGGSGSNGNGTSTTHSTTTTTSETPTTGTTHSTTTTTSETPTTGTTHSTTTTTSETPTTETTHSTETETSTETPHESESETTVPGSGVLPDINSPMIALVGVLCVIGGLVAITRR